MKNMRLQSKNIQFSKQITTCILLHTVSENDNICYHSSTQLSATVWGRSAHIESLKVEKNFDLLPNFWYIKDSNITSGAQRKIFEKGTIFFGILLG